MPTGTIIMIVCAVLYGLIVFFFNDDKKLRKDDPPVEDDRFTGADGTPGGRGFCSKDFDTHPVK